MMPLRNSLFLLLLKAKNQQVHCLHLFRSVKIYLVFRFFYCSPSTVFGGAFPRSSAGGFFRLEGLGAAGFVYLVDVSKSPSVDKSPQPFEPRPLTQDCRLGLRPARKCRRLYRTFIFAM
jgi:hypothetical protein